ncbi:MAG: LysR family transcriptional regulator [Betaproteobacteria bacterium HGW-Betaproteobacteria-12]|nr:MAG: LysR family transcriptional regulator [Betaproteobacteria bacterium HGW-Betaproteobacteria-12]
MSKLPDLEGWAIFAKVAEAGSFARAAEELSLSQATVSKAISRLEKRMKITLFHRTSRRMSLTASGLTALEGASRVLEAAEAIEAELAEQSASLCGPVRVAAPMSFGLSHLGPVLPAFMMKHPEISLDIEFGDELTDLVANRFDMALRISSLADSSLLARRLCTVRILLVGAPAYFERYGRPRHPQDLLHHRTLQYAYSRDGANWRFRHEHNGEFVHPVSTSLRVNNAEGLAPALKSGLGLALQPEFLAWQDLQSGELETVMDDWQVEPIALHIVTPPGRRRPARVQALIDYLADHFSNVPWARQMDLKAPTLKM